MELLFEFLSIIIADSEVLHDFPHNKNYIAYPINPYEVLLLFNCQLCRIRVSNLTSS